MVASAQTGAHLDLAAIVLVPGVHARRTDEVSLLEATAWWAGEPHSDSPACVSPVLAMLGRGWADALDDGARQRLKPLIPKLATTASGGTWGPRDFGRALALVDWLCRQALPSLLRPAGVTAGRLGALAPVDGWRAAVAARHASEEAKAATRVALDAAWVAARSGSVEPHAVMLWLTGQAGIAAAVQAAGRGLAPVMGGGGDLERALIDAVADLEAQRDPAGALAGVCATAAGLAVRDAAAAADAAALTSALRAAPDTARAMLRPTLRDLQAAMFALFDQLCDPKEDADG